MAENEVLYVAGSRRWRRTRKALAAGVAVEEIAACAVADLDHGLRAAFRKGETLQTLFRVACTDQAALRAVVETFRDQPLARIVAKSIQACGNTDPMAAARCAGDLIIDRIVEQMRLYAWRNNTFQEPESREALTKALTSRFEVYRPQLIAVLERLMRGERVQQLRPTRASPRPTAQSLVKTSLLPPAVSSYHGARER